VWSVYGTLKITGCSVVAACVTLTLTSPISAQSVAAPPASGGGLFGPTRSEAAVRDRLSVTLDVSETLENNVPPEFRSQVVPDDLQSGGLSTMLTASADYARNRHRVQLAGSLLSAFRYYTQLDAVAAVSHSASLGASVRLPGQGSLQVSQSVAYSPAYLYQLFPTTAVAVSEEAIPVNPDYRITPNNSYSYMTKAAVAFGSPRSFRVTTTADYNRSDFQSETASGSNLKVYGVGVQGSRSMARNGGLSVEYQYRAGEFGFGGKSTEHRITFGVDYSRALSTKRRATFHLKLTPSTLEFSQSVLGAFVTDAVPSAADRREYLLQAEAGIDYQFRRNWHATGNLSRGVEYLPWLGGPVVAKAARAELAGLITRSVDLSAVAGYATGASAVYLGAQDLETRTFDVRVRYALKRSFALYTEYLYYYYDLRGQIGLGPGQSSVFGEHAVRLGFTLFVEPLRR